MYAIVEVNDRWPMKISMENLANPVSPYGVSGKDEKGKEYVDLINSANKREDLHVFNNGNEGVLEIFSWKGKTKIIGEAISGFSRQVRKTAPGEEGYTIIPNLRAVWFKK